MVHQRGRTPACSIHPRAAGDLCPHVSSSSFFFVFNGFLKRTKACVLSRITLKTEQKSSVRGTCCNPEKAFLPKGGVDSWVRPASRRRKESLLQKAAKLWPLQVRWPLVPTSAAGLRRPELCRPRAPRSRTYPTGRCALPASTETPRELRGDVHLWGHLPPRPSLSHLTCGFVLAGRGNDSLFLSQAFSADSKNKPAVIKLQM